MKKTFIAVALVLSMASVACAQELTGGVKLGLNSSNVKYTFDGGSAKGDARISAHVGFYAIYMFQDKFGFQPEFVISGEGSKGYGDAKLALTYINIPLLLRMNVIENLSIHTGPQVGFLVSAKAKDDGNSIDVKDSFKGIGLGWGLGAMYDLPKNFNVGLRYNFGLSRIDDSDDEGKSKVSTLQISLGYKLF